jgi:hypothetical protein
MIMKRNKISISILLFYIIIFPGCDDGLDLIPPGEVSETIFWQQERDARLAVNAAYGELDGTLMVKELDGVTDIGYRASSGPGTLHDVGAGTIDPTNSAIGSQWDRYYRGVRKANDVITNIGRIEQGDPELLARLEAEARFLRAFYYTQLTSLWGDVPLILEPLEINDHRGRNDKKEVVDFIIQELDGIIDSNALPLSYSAEIGRATHGAALALKARVAIRNGRYEIARDAALEVMELGVYELYPHYGELFQYAGQNSSEVIFDRQYAVGGDTYNAFSYSAASIGGSSVVEPIHNLYKKYEHQGPVNPNDPYENLDPRWDFTVYYTGQPIGNSIFNSWPSSNTTDRVSANEWATDHGYNLKKWIDYEADNANPDIGSINMILIRYADVLLMYAEAKVELGEMDQSVYDAINQVRGRPSVEMPPVTPGKTQAELREIIRNERAVELAFEGLRLFDMNRWEIGEEKVGLVEGMYYQPEGSGEWRIWNSGFERRFRPDRDYLWPIPQAEIEINDAITQNPNY